MKYIHLIFSLILFVSCASLEKIIEFGSDYIEIEKPKLKFSPTKLQSSASNTLLIELPNIPQLTIVQDPDTNFILQPVDHELRAGKAGVYLIYNDTISYFNSKTLTEKFKITKHEIPISIIKAN